MAELTTHGDSVYACKKEACSVAVDGKCLEAFELTECPFLTVDDVLDSTPSSEEPEGDTAEIGASDTEYIDLFSGEDLDLAAARKITRGHMARVVVIAGEPDSGKTTLLACLNDLFQAGPYAGYLFAGSRTLVGFERRCFKARIRSQRTNPDTERSKRSAGIRFLHLRVRDEALADQTQHLLLSDVSGEIFRQATDSSDEVKNLRMLRRADHLVLLLDGAKLVDLALRHETKARANLLLRGCLDENMLGVNSFVDVVYSKWDIIETSSNVEIATQFIEAISQEMSELFASRLGRLRFHRLCARPHPESSVQIGFGLEPLFQSWIRDSPFIRRASEPKPEKHSHDREFTRFLWRFPS